MPILVFTIALKSNYHLGAGYGKGFGVDSALLREEREYDQQPVIRGTTLCGLLRDGARRLLESPVMEKYREKEDEILGRIFGGSEKIKRWRIGSAYLAEEVSDDSQVVRRVRIDPVIRRAEPQKLFSQEEGLAGQVFVFQVECPGNGAAALDEAALIVAAARNVRHLGRYRRRGLGECVIHLIKVENLDTFRDPPEEEWEAWFLRRFQDNWLQGTPAAPAKSEMVMPEVIAPVQAKWEPIRLRVIARLDEPVLVAGQSLTGNQYETLQYLPGSTILGALAARAAQRGGLDRAETYQDFISLFRRDAVFFPVLYPAYYHNNRLDPAVPAPRALLTCSLQPFRKAQGDSHGIHPAFLLATGKTGKRICPEEKCPGKMEPLGGFLILHSSVRVYEPPRRLEMHIRVDERHGRVRKGDLFGYTLLAAGQYFLGEMICADGEAWRRLKALCGIEEKKTMILFLGKARQRGYGRATLWFEPEEGPPSWIQKSLDERVPDRPETVSLTLLTDAVIADPWGRQAVGFTPEWLERELGLGEIEIVEAHAQARTVDGFNTTLGLPRWRDLALEAGSVAWLRFRTFPASGKERMRELEIKGIGLRRNEGFGRIAFNHPLCEEWRGLGRSAVYLPDEMDLERADQSERFPKLSWQEEIEEMLSVDPTLDERFLALARWLYLNSALPVEELVTRVKSFGNPDEGLKNFVGGEKEFGVRNKESFFVKGQQKEVVDRILCLLNAVQKRESPDHRQTAIQLLAERIGGMVNQKKGE